MPQGSEEKEALLPIEMLRSLDINGEFTIGELVVRKIQMENVQLVISLQRGVIKIAPLTADLYGGKLHTTTRLDVRQKAPVIEVDHTLDRIDLGPLLQDFTGKKTLTGNADIKATLETIGAVPQDWLKNVKGNLFFVMKDGTIRGINVPQMIRNTVQTIKGTGTVDPETKATDFTQLKAQARFDSGIARESKLSLDSPLLQLSGIGNLDLVRQLVNYSFQVKLTEEFKKQTDLDLSESGEITIPLKLSGSFSDPEYTMDLKDVIEDIGKDKIKQQVIQFLQDTEEDNAKEQQDTGRSGTVDPKQLLKGILQK
jgi:AsmA protein